jgi:RecB family exonuclease
VTQIETLVRDPYAIYARKVLGLRRLDPPGREADALARGSAVHAVLERFAALTAGALPPQPGDIFAAAVREVLAAQAPWPAVRAIWTARLDRIAPWFLAGEAERRGRGTPAAREVKGSRALDGLALPFAVTARADRIDRTPDGGYAIYDYKSGGVPSATEAEAFHLQLPLEAAILAAGGFEGLPAGSARHLALIGLNACKVLPLDPDPEAVATTIARLCRLIAHYQDPAMGFTARQRPQRLVYDSDYDHLSRFGEWGDGDPPEAAP